MEETLEIYKKLSMLGYIDSLGSMGLMFSYVAVGRIQAAVIANKDTFPLFAGKIIVEEAGGIVSDFKGGDLTIHTRGIIAAITKVHQKILDLNL